MRNNIEYQREYRAKNRERLNKLSRDCMRLKRAREKAERIQFKRDNPGQADYIKKSITYIKRITN